MKNRNELIDYLKGFLIILVVIGHAIQHNDPNYDSNFVFRFIYSFHMPLFMFVSGYVSIWGKDNNTLMLFQKFKSLVIPFWTWVLVSFIFTNIHNLNNGSLLINFLTNIKLVIKQPDNGLWFLWILFLNHFVLFISKKINSKKEVLIMILALVLINACWRLFKIEYFGINLLSWYLLFYIIGYVCNKFEIQLSKYLNFIGLFSIILFSLLVGYWSRIQTPVFLDKLNISSAIKGVSLLSYYYLVAISGTMMVYVIFKNIINYQFFLKKQFLFLGKITLEIYCSHIYFFSILNTSNYSIPLSLKVLISFILGIGTSILLYYVTRNIKLFTVIFYGKKNK